MSVDVFFDTNVLIYAVSDDDLRSAAARALLVEGGVISVQVLNEFVAVARRKLKRSWPETIQAIAVFRLACPDVVPLRISTHEAAVRLAQQDGFDVYDALIVASALEAGCSTLLTEDMQDGRVIDGRLTVRNPFAPA